MKTNSNLKKLFAICMSMAMIATTIVIPQTALAADSTYNGITVSGGVEGVDYTWGGTVYNTSPVGNWQETGIAIEDYAFFRGDIDINSRQFNKFNLNIKTSTPLTVTGTSTVKWTTKPEAYGTVITVASGITANLTLQDYNNTRNSNNKVGLPTIAVLGTLNLKVKGNNKIYNAKDPAIYVAEGATLNMGNDEGEDIGYLCAEGLNSYNDGAIIGAPRALDAGTMTFGKVKLDVKSKFTSNKDCSGPAIGSKGNFGDITFNEGCEIYAESTTSNSQIPLMYSGLTAAIGGGEADKYKGNIYINGGKITAKGTRNGIGTSNGIAGDTIKVIISGEPEIITNTQKTTPLINKDGIEVGQLDVTFSKGSDNYWYSPISSYVFANPDDPSETYEVQGYGHVTKSHHVWGPVGYYLSHVTRPDKYAPCEYYPLEQRVVAHTTRSVTCCDYVEVGFREKYGYIPSQFNVRTDISQKSATVGITAPYGTSVEYSVVDPDGNIYLNESFVKTSDNSKITVRASNTPLNATTGRGSIDVNELATSYSTPSSTSSTYSPSTPSPDVEENYDDYGYFDQDDSMTEKTIVINNLKPNTNYTLKVSFYRGDIFRTLIDNGANDRGTHKEYSLTTPALRTDYGYVFTNSSISVPAPKAYTGNPYSAKVSLIPYYQSLIKIIA